MESSFYDRAGQATRICDKRQQIVFQNDQGLTYGFISENFYASPLVLEREESRAPFNRQLFSSTKNTIMNSTLSSITIDTAIPSYLSEVLFFCQAIDCFN